MKKYLLVMVTVICMGLLVAPVAMATLTGPTPVYDPTNDSPSAMSAILGFTVVSLPIDITIWADDRYATVSWDFSSTGSEAYAVAVKDGTAGGPGLPKWVWYGVTEDQRITGGGDVNTLADGQGSISHINLYGTVGQGKVPEPITLILYGLGFAGAGLYRRFRRRPK